MTIVCCMSKCYGYGMTHEIKMTYVRHDIKKVNIVNKEQPLLISETKVLYII